MVQQNPITLWMSESIRGAVNFYISLMLIPKITAIKAPCRRNRSLHTVIAIIASHAAKVAVTIASVAMPLNSIFLATVL